MKQTAEAFYKSIKGKKVAFIGAGVSHKELIPIFADAGACVTLCDKKERGQLGELAGQYEKLGVCLCLGENYLSGLAGQEVIVRSPGFEYYTPELVRAGESGAFVTSEMELFFALCPCRIYGVTGSDGKTTTTTLISEMLKAAGKTVHLGGNIGRALLPIVRAVKETDVAVVELSSFQLISMRQSPDVAVVTNVTPNHLDHHKDMQEYIDAKRNILLYQTPSSKAVLGFENSITRSMEGDVQGKRYWFSRLNRVEEGAFLDEEGFLCLAQAGQVQRVMHSKDVLLPGAHNIENLLCAMAAVWGEVPLCQMAQVGGSFTGVEHRIEPVRERLGVRWYNDSIATSPTRTIAGLHSFEQKLILIAGGYDKGISYAPLAPELVAHVKLLILMGNTADKIEAALHALPEFAKSGLEVLRVETMEEAVNTAAARAKEGDIVSLSPASASFDRYPNFEKRGEHYKALVNAL